MQLLSTLPLALTAALLLGPIRNPGFESGDLSHWSTSATFDGAVTGDESHSGDYSLRMEAMDLVYQDLAGEAERRYARLEFHALAEEAWSTGPAYATVYYLDGSSRSFSFGGSALGSGTWTRFELRLARRKRVDKVAFSLGESTPIYVDDVALRRM